MAENKISEDKIKKVLVIYRKRLEEMGIAKKRFPSNLFPHHKTDILAHCHAMLYEMEVYVQQGSREKVFRWLGFLQGCFWVYGLYTVDEMRDHNRP